MQVGEHLLVKYYNIDILEGQSKISTQIIYFCNLLKLSWQKVAMEPNIKVLYIQCFYINDQQDNSSLLCIEFQILHCKSWLKIGF